MRIAHLGISKNSSLSKEQRGMTIFELLGVLIILGVVAAIAIPAVAGVINKSKEDTDQQTIQNVGRSFALWMDQRDANGDCKLDLASDGTSNVVSVGDGISAWTDSNKCAVRTDTRLPSLNNGGYNPDANTKFKPHMAVIKTAEMVSIGLLKEQPKSLSQDKNYGNVYLKYKIASPNSGYWILHHIATE